MFYTVINKIIRFLFFFIFRIKVEGRENIPKEGGAIVAINHRSNWDVPVAGTVCPRKLSFMAKAEMFKSKIGNWLFSNLGAFPVQRGKGDIGAIKAALGRLKAGEIIAMFPEGRRVKEGTTVEPKPGVVMLATRANVPVIPTRIVGKYKWFGKITVKYGKPITYEDFQGEKLAVEDLNDLSKGLMSVIYSL